MLRTQIKECQTIPTSSISILRTFIFYCRHHGCECPEGWKGDHCELQIKKASSMTGEFAHEVGDALSGNKIVWIILVVIIGVFSALYFKRYHLIKEQGKSKRRRRRKQEMTAFSDDTTTRDII